MRDQVFLDNVIVLTGASSGIGRNVALQLAEQGACLALAARNVEKLEAVAEQCRERGGKVLVVPTDVAEPSQCQNLIRCAAKGFGRIDTLINNAGMSMAAGFDQISDVAVFEKIMHVNFFSSVYCTYYALPYLKETRGRLVGISSLAGRFPAPTATGYAATKHAMAGFFDSLRIELADRGVSVTMIYPGWVTTGISARAFGADGEPTGKTSKHEIGAMKVDVCARLIVHAAAKRKREVVMTLPGKIGLWLRLLTPGMVDLIARKMAE